MQMNAEGWFDIVKRVQPELRSELHNSFPGTRRCERFFSTVANISGQSKPTSDNVSGRAHHHDVVQDIKGREDTVRGFVVHMGRKPRKDYNLRLTHWNDGTDQRDEWWSDVARAAKPYTKGKDTMRHRNKGALLGMGGNANRGRVAATPVDAAATPLVAAATVTPVITAVPAAAAADADADADAAGAAPPPPPPPLPPPPPPPAGKSGAGQGKGGGKRGKAPKPPKGRGKGRGRRGRGT